MLSSVGKAFIKHGNLHYEKKMCHFLIFILLAVCLLFLLAAFLSYKFPSPNPRYIYNVQISLVLSLIFFLFFLFFIIKRSTIKKSINEIVTDGIPISATVLGSLLEGESEILIKFPGYTKAVVANFWKIQDHPSYQEDDKVELLLHPKNKKLFLFKTTIDKYYSG